MCPREFCKELAGPLRLLKVTTYGNLTKIGYVRLWAHCFKKKNLLIFQGPSPLSILEYKNSVHFNTWIAGWWIKWEHLNETIIVQHFEILLWRSTHCFTLIFSTELLSIFAAYEPLWLTPANILAMVKVYPKDFMCLHLFEKICGHQQNCTNVHSASDSIYIIAALLWGTEEIAEHSGFYILLNIFLLLEFGDVSRVISIARS